MQWGNARPLETGATRVRVVLSVLAVMLVLSGLVMLGRWNSAREDRAEAERYADIWEAYGRGRYEAARDLLNYASTWRDAKTWAEDQMDEYYEDSEEYQTMMGDRVQQAMDGLPEP